MVTDDRKLLSRKSWFGARYFQVGRLKVKEFRNMPGVAQRVPGGLSSQIFMTFSTRKWRGCQPHASAAFTPRKCSWYSLN